MCVGLGWVPRWCAVGHVLIEAGLGPCVTCVRERERGSERERERENAKQTGALKTWRYAECKCYYCAF